MPSNLLQGLLQKLGIGRELEAHSGGMATLSKGFQDDLEASISELVREKLKAEHPFTKTSLLNKAASKGARFIANDVTRSIAEDTKHHAGIRALDLMDLPPEMRNRIWHWTLLHTDFPWRHEPKPIEFEYHSVRVPGHEHPGVQPALTRVSRQVRSESLAIFYDINDSHIMFRAANPRSMVDVMASLASRWLTAIGPANAKLLNKVQISYYHGLLRTDGMSIEEIMADAGFAMVASVAVIKRQ